MGVSVLIDLGRMRFLFLSPALAVPTYPHLTSLPRSPTNIAEVASRHLSVRPLHGNVKLY